MTRTVPTGIPLHILELREIRQEYPEYDVEAVTLGIVGLSNASIRRALAVGRKHQISPDALVPMVEAALKFIDPATGAEGDERGGAG